MIADYGKIPPQAVDVECNVLGAMMLFPDAADKVSLLLRSEMFYRTEHQKIYEAIMSLKSEAKGVDMLTVAERLKELGSLEDVGGVYYISTLSNKVDHDLYVMDWSLIIVDRWVKREAISIGSMLQRDGFDDTIDGEQMYNIINDSTKHIGELVYGTGLNYHDIGSIANSNVSKYIRISSGEVINGVPVVLKAVRRYINQYSNGDLVIVAARPGMGKTAHMISEAKIYAEMGIPVAIFSEEMTKEQLTDRFISQEASLPVNLFRRGMLTDSWKSRLMNAAKAFKNVPIYIEDDLRNVFDMQPRLSNLVKNKGVQIAYFDYLQRSRTGKKQPQEQEINEITQQLKTVARACKVPVVAYAQLSRGVETRGGDHRPVLSDLRGSGSIENEADVVVFIYRPAYYKIEAFDDGRSTDGCAELIIEKHRQGSIGTAQVEFVSSLMKFKDRDEETGEEQPDVYEDYEEHTPF